MDNPTPMDLANAAMAAATATPVSTPNQFVMTDRIKELMLGTGKKQYSGDNIFIRGYSTDPSMAAQEQELETLLSNVTSPEFKITGDSVAIKIGDFYLNVAKEYKQTYGNYTNWKLIHSVASKDYYAIRLMDNSVITKEEFESPEYQNKRAANPNLYSPKPDGKGGMEVIDIKAGQVKCRFYPVEHVF